MFGLWVEVGLVVWRTGAKWSLLHCETERVSLVAGVLSERVLSRSLPTSVPVVVVPSSLSVARLGPWLRAPIYA